MIEILGGAPPVILGIAVLVIALAWAIDKAGPELRKWVTLVRRAPTSKN